MRRLEAWLTALIVLIAVPVHVAGIAVPGLYRDPAVLLPQNIATDLVTLAIAIPLLGCSLLWSVSGSLRARLLWLGALGYLAYAYGMYAVAVRWNPLFLAYVALFGLACYALIAGLTGIDAQYVRVDRGAARLAAGYLLAVAVMVATVWLAEEIPAAARDAVPATVAQFQTPTNIVHVFDLGVVLPAFVVSAVLLLRRRPWGTVLAGLLLVKAVAIGLWVLAMTWFSAQRGIAAPAAMTVLFAALTLAGAVVAARFLGAVGWWRVDVVPAGFVADTRHAA